MDASPHQLYAQAEEKRPRISTSRVVLALMLAAPLAFGLVFGGASFFTAFPPVIVVSAIGAVIGVVTLLVERRWATVVAGVTALLILALGASDPTPGGMTRPSLGLQMSWGHAARFAGLVGILAALAELRRGRAASSGRLPRAVPYVAFLAAGLMLGIGATTQAALVDDAFAQGGTVVAVQPDATLEVVERENAFFVEATVPRGALVRIVLENQDDFMHSFTAEGIDVDSLGASTTEILARSPASARDWAFYCKYHPEMTGSVRVA